MHIDQFDQVLAEFSSCSSRFTHCVPCGTPAGVTAYVLTENPHSYWLWNPSTGKHYLQREAYCPLTSVGCVINHQDVIRVLPALVFICLDLTLCLLHKHHTATNLPILSLPLSLPPTPTPLPLWPLSPTLPLSLPLCLPPSPPSLPMQVWTNIQDYEDPSRIVFDLENSKHWRTLFPADMQPLATVQVELIPWGLLVTIYECYWEYMMLVS